MRLRDYTRIVFDEYIPATDYIDAVNQVGSVSYIMGEILDSFYVKQYTVDQYKQRVTEYLNQFAAQVDIWEVGNEINGEWLGDTASVVAKMTDAYNQVKGLGKTAELTLYYNQDCWSNPSNEMFTWANANIPTYMKQGLDYVLVSYYEADCNGLRPDWTSVFHQLAQMFPNSKIGFGETGDTNPLTKADTINRYYTLQIAEPNYVGGYFWWYFYEDMVPYSDLMWSVLNSAIQ